MNTPRIIEARIIGATMIGVNHQSTIIRRLSQAPSKGWYQRAFITLENNIMAPLDTGSVPKILRQGSYPERFGYVDYYGRDKIDNGDAAQYQAFVISKTCSGWPSYNNFLRMIPTLMFRRLIHQGNGSDQLPGSYRIKDEWSMNIPTRNFMLQGFPVYGGLMIYPFFEMLAGTLQNPLCDKVWVETYEKDEGIQLINFGIDEFGLFDHFTISGDALRSFVTQWDVGL